MSLARKTDIAVAAVLVALMVALVAWYRVPLVPTRAPQRPSPTRRR